MFENLKTLQQRRTQLHQELAEVNERIRQEFHAADQQIAEMRRAIGFDGESTPRKKGNHTKRSAEDRARQSASMKASWARLKAAAKANGADHNTQPYSA